MDAERSALKASKAGSRSPMLSSGRQSVDAWRGVSAWDSRLQVKCCATRTMRCRQRSKDVA
eukprot:1063382-Alexandrium_andersonii.AAC.1